MIQFNLNRFAKLAKWSLTNDMKYHVKSFWQMLVILALFFMFFTMVFRTEGNDLQGYQMCAFGVISIFVFTLLIVGPSLMFYSMEGKHDMQTLLMLPASNFEKYLMRYASWLILLPIYLVGFLGADLLQYVAHLVTGQGEGMFVASVVVNGLSRMWAQMPDKMHGALVHAVIPIILWLHSFYALGATFFRWRKHNWVLTTLALMVLVGLQAWIFPYSVSAEEAPTTDFILNDVLCAFWTVLNFWLSYRLFCRRQVIGKFVNL